MLPEEKLGKGLSMLKVRLVSRLVSDQLLIYSALKSYEDVMNIHASKLITTLQAHLAKPLDVAK
jgi:hypothetical protein